jgi:hypothetical protein
MGIEFDYFSQLNSKEKRLNQALELDALKGEVCRI